MNREKSSKEMYISPAIKIYQVRAEHLLQQASGQHNPIHGGGTIGDAKRNDLWSEEDETTETENIWNND